MAGSSPEGELVEVEDKMVQIVTWEGRDYQRYSLTREINLSPCDQDEADRLEKQHFMLKELLSDEDWPAHRLFPKLAGQPRNFLDLGFGTALWCAEVGQNDLGGRVTGIDITSNMAVDDNPPNVELELQNLNEELIVSEQNNFDFVRMHFIAGGISRSRWPGLLSDVFNKVLKPQGVLQSMEWDLQFRSNNHQEDSLANLQEWNRLYHLALDTTSRPEGRKILRVADIEDFLRAARFQVSSSVVDVPIGRWPTQRRLQNIGQKNLENMTALVESIATYVVVSRRVCDVTAFKAVVEAAKVELANEGAQPYVRLHISWGKKMS